MAKIIKRIIWLIMFTTILLIAFIFYLLLGWLLWILSGKLYVEKTVFKLFDKIDFLRDSK